MFRHHLTGVRRPVAILSLISLLAGGVGAVIDASAAGGDPRFPTWWSKFLTVSAPGFVPGVSVGATQSVTIGPNIDVSNEPGPQSETSIAINPANPSQIVGGANEINRLPMRGYFSSDGGQTWGGVDLPLPPPRTNNGTDFGSDPGVAWDTLGNVYYCYIVVFFGNGFNHGGAAVNGSAMAVARSSDGGHTWTATYFAPQTGGAQFDDKPMITVDTNPLSPRFNTVYVAWDNTNGAQGKPSSTSGILVSSSTDHGVTFTAPVFASSRAPGPKADIGADPLVAPDGTVHVAWLDSQNSRIVESSSTDGGASFGATHVISPTRVAFDVAIPAQSVRRVLVYPACGADASSGVHRGTLYCSWADETPANGMDVFLSRSADAGQTWTAPLRVNDDPTGVANDQFYQWLAVDPSDGSLNMSWYDTRNDPTHFSTDVFFGRSVDGGTSFGANLRVTTAMTNESCCGAQLHDQYGDYEGIAALNGSIHPIWTDRRASLPASLNEETFTATITVSTTTRHR